MSKRPIQTPLHYDAYGSIVQGEPTSIHPLLPTYEAYYDHEISIFIIFRRPQMPYRIYWISAEQTLYTHTVLPMVVGLIAILFYQPLSLTSNLTEQCHINKSIVRLKSFLPSNKHFMAFDLKNQILSCLSAEITSQRRDQHLSLQTLIAFLR